MRVGDYGEFEGRTYRASNPHAPTIRLYADDGTPPPGFERNRRGEWSRLVHRSELTRLTTVRTVAVWRGRRTTVKGVFDAEGEALVEHRSWPPPEGPKVWAIDNGVWQARVPIGDLTEVVEEAFDVEI